MVPFTVVLDGKRQSWWPDWSGQTVVIAASGPSQNREQLELAKGKAKVIAINETWQLVPWCDALYGCDANWWEIRKPKYNGLKISGEYTHGCHWANVVGEDRIFLDGEKVGAGGNSGFQVINLLIYWKPKRIILTGVDCTGTHWHGEHGNGLRNASPKTQERWINCFRIAKKALDNFGIECVNANPNSAVDAFPFTTMDKEFP